MWSRKEMHVIGTRRARNISIVALAFAVIVALPYACIVHCMFATHDAHHDDHCPMDDTSHGMPLLDQHIPIVQLTTYLPPAVHTVTLFGGVIVAVTMLQWHHATRRCRLSTCLSPPATPPPR